MLFYFRTYKGIFPKYFLIPSRAEADENGSDESLWRGAMKILENMLRCFSDWEETAVSWRRLLHRHAQPGWLEFFATGFIAEKLESWEIEISQGTKILDAEGRLFVPPESVLDREYRRALRLRDRKSVV